MTTGNKPTTPTPRYTSPRILNEDSPIQKKKKPGGPDDHTTTKKGKTKARTNNVSDTISSDNEDEDAMSIDTPKDNNTSDTSINALYTSFLYFRFKVKASKKGSETLQRKYKNFSGLRRLLILIYTYDITN